MPNCTSTLARTRAPSTPEELVPTARSSEPLTKRHCSSRPAHAALAAAAAHETCASHDDCMLMHAHLAGDPQAFNELIRRHRTLLRVVALRVLENHHDADDAVQDSLIRAFRSAHTYSGRSSVGAWLRTIVENTARTAARSRSRDQNRVVQIDGTQLAEAEQVGGDPAVIVANRERIASALAQIPLQWRRTFVLVKINGLSYAEAAEVLDIPIGTVRSRINRANAARAKQRAQKTSAAPGTI